MAVVRDLPIWGRSGGPSRFRSTVSDRPKTVGDSNEMLALKRPLTTSDRLNNNGTDSGTFLGSPSAQLALVIALSERHTPRAQDVVCSDGVEIEVGQRKRKDEGLRRKG
jgi:hypothetical protein